ncbi:MAG TPA: cellulase family glycosylhydrolase [Candidatus Magasanikbacteria bacterium]|nr:cellulase family glycosylhydrolase [Candidatus Magasanikbacteria bacterium]
MKKILLSLLAAVLITTGILWFWNFGKNETVEWGVTFSQIQTDYLKLDWKKTYTAILDDLGVKNLRLLAYWSQIGVKDGDYNFTDLDWQVQEAERRGIKIVLGIGRRLPRWPECQAPEWTEDLSETEIQQKILTMLQTTVEHYKKYNNIVMWQVDNEPLVDWFGQCPPPDKNFVKQEIALVKSLDSRPILVTDSGELSFWREASKLGGDYFGTTMYRTVWNNTTGYFSYKYLIPPAFYNFKARLAKLNPAKVIIAELQAEPWLREDISLISLEEQKQSMTAEKMEEAVRFARRTGFGAAYLWGAEYWYWLKTEKNDDSLWWTAKQIFQNNLPK